MDSGWTPRKPDGFPSALWLRSADFCLVVQAFHPVVNAASCWWYVERDECNSQRQHPEAENRQEAEYSTDHEEDTQQRADAARHMIVTPVHDAVGVQRNPSLEFCFIQNAVVCIILLV